MPEARLFRTMNKAIFKIHYGKRVREGAYNSDPPERGDG
jgi:hypothetical protein